MTYIPAQVPTNMFSYKTGIILLVKYPIVYENISPGIKLVHDKRLGCRLSLVRKFHKAPTRSPLLKNMVRADQDLH